MKQINEHQVQTEFDFLTAKTAKEFTLRYFSQDGTNPDRLKPRMMEHFVLVAAAIYPLVDQINKTAFLQTEVLKERCLETNPKLYKALYEANPE